MQWARLGCTQEYGWHHGQVDAADSEASGHAR